METFETAKLGIEISTWFRSPIGKFVLEKAEREVEEAQSILLDLKSTDSEAIQEQQTIASQARLAIIWLNTAISDGEIAERNLQEEESHG